MRTNTARTLTRRSGNEVVKVPQTSQFAGDSIMSVTIKTKSKKASPVGNFPIPLFAPIHDKADYDTFHKNIPSGYILTITRNDDGSYDFKYSDGGDTNNIVITVQSSTLPYASILLSLLRNDIKFSNTRLTVAPEAKATEQFSQKMVTSYKSMFGGAISNQIEVDINKRPSDFSKDIIDIPQPIKVDMNTALIVYYGHETTMLNMAFSTSNYSVGANNL